MKVRLIESTRILTPVNTVVILTDKDYTILTSKADIYTELELILMKLKDSPSCRTYNIARLAASNFKISYHDDTYTIMQIENN